MHEGSINIIVVDDDAAHVDAILRAFNTTDKFIIRVAETLNHYKQLVKEHAPDLALVDLNLPDGSAVDVLVAPLDEGFFPILVMTSCGSEQIVVQALKCGALDYVVKSPEAFADMPRIAERALREWALIRSRKMAEAALHESEVRYRRIVETISDYIFTVKIQNGYPIETTHGEGCIAITGYSVDEFAADPWLWRRMVLDEDAPSVLNQLENIMQGKSTASVEHRILRKDNTVRWVRSTLVPFISPAGDLLSYDGIIQDITEQKNLELQLRHSQKLEGIGQLAGGIAHDFNNFLTAIIGYSTMLLMKMPEPSPLREYAEQIIDAADRASNLTKSLLLFSRKDMLETRVHNLNTVIAGTVKLLERLLSDSIKLSVNYAKEDIIVMADAGQIGQVIFNLVTNARDAMPKDGNIVISTKIIHSGQSVSENGSVKPAGKYAVIAVSDSGRGIDESIKDKIFEPFFTTKEIGKGTGLGLSIIYGIVRQHNGYIDVDSKQGQGTTFKIYIPLAADGVQMSLDLAVTESSSRGTETILIAEDNRVVRTMLSGFLSGHGYHVLEAKDGDEALGVYERYAEKIGLVLADVIMPTRNGWDVCHEIRRRAPGIKILMMSGYSVDFVRKMSGYDDQSSFIAKPIIPKDLFRKIRAVLDSK